MERARETAGDEGLKDELDEEEIRDPGAVRVGFSDTFPPGLYTATFSLSSHLLTGWKGFWGLFLFLQGTNSTTGPHPPDFILLNHPVKAQP